MYEGSFQLSGSHIRVQHKRKTKVTRHVQCRAARAPARLQSMSVQIQMQVRAEHLPQYASCHLGPETKRWCEPSLRGTSRTWSKTPLALQRSHPASVSGQQKQQRGTIRCPGGCQASKSGGGEWSRSRCRTEHPGGPNEPWLARCAWVRGCCCPRGRFQGLQARKLHGLRIILYEDT